MNKEIKVSNNPTFAKEKHYSLADRFFEAFNQSRCKTTLLVISILFTIIYGIAVLSRIENESLNYIMLLIISFWIGRASKKPS